MMHRRKIATTIVAVSALAVGALVGAPTASAAQKRAVPDSVPKWLGSAQSLGKASANAPVSFRVYLAPKGGLAALETAVAQISNPTSASYRKFVSAAAYHRQYDPSAASVSTVRSWLAGAGLSVTGVAGSNRYLSVTGTVAQAQTAFSATINSYRHNGRTVQANTAALQVPDSVAGAILSVSGIDSTPHVVKPSSAPTEPPPAAFANARPCSTSYGQIAAKYRADFRTPLPKYNGKTLPYAVCGYAGPQLRAYYGQGVYEQGLDGSGVTVAITDAYNAPTIVKDVQTYATRHGDGSYVKKQLTVHQPAAAYNRQDICDPQGWYGEQTLDIEAVHAMAPAANIAYYASASCFDDDFLDTLARVVDDNKAQLVSNSWGDLDEVESADNINAYESVFLQGALQGISFLFSSGDNGDELQNSALRQTDYPASDPYVTAVGGTSIGIGPGGTRVFKTGWGTHRVRPNANLTAWDPTTNTFLYGAGGGSSNLFDKPDYQQGIVPVSNGPGRAVPDVSMDADPTTGMLVGETQTYPDGSVAYGEYRIGGTSLASPLFAGFTALLLQYSGSSIGFLNPTIYDQYRTGSFSDVRGPFPDAGNVRVDYVNGVDSTDGLLYTVRTFNQDSSLQVKRGWDDVTGVGEGNKFWVTSIPPVA